MDKIYKISFFVMVAVLLVGAGILLGRGGFDEKMAGEKEEGKVEEKVVEEEREIIATVTKTPTAEVEEEEDEDLEEIFGLAFEEKFNKQAGTAEVTISKVEDEHVSGGIKFVGDMGGGWFLGAKDEGEWVIVADGNGTVDCAKIEPYDFSTEMVPECWDETTMTLIKR